MLLLSGSTIEGTDAGGWLSGDECDNTFLTGGGDDEIYDPHGSNIIAGGDGIDTLVVYEGNLVNDRIVHEDDGPVRITGPGMDGTTVQNLLENVERVQGNEQTLELSVAADATFAAPSEVDGFGRSSSEKSQAEVVPAEETSSCPMNLRRIPAPTPKQTLK